MSLLDIATAGGHSNIYQELLSWHNLIVVL